MNSRRVLLKSLALAPLAAWGATRLQAGTFTRRIHVFSKHLQWLNYNAMAETAAGIGFDGVDITVRPKGHVLPENVERDLPRAVRAVREAGLVADRITTAITDPADPLTTRILETAANLGIRIYRMGWLKYDRERPLPPQIDDLRGRMEQLADLNQRTGIHGAYQNHTGTGVGAPVWDAWLLVRNLDPRWLGIRFDIRHATVEGGESWELGLQLVAPHIRSLDVKDFAWARQDGTWKIVDVPLGQGAVNFDRYLALLEKWQVQGDMTMHFEYPLGGADKGQFELKVDPSTVINAMTRDLALMRSMP